MRIEITTITIEGFLVGPIWQGIESHKTLNYDVTTQQRRTVGKMTLRDHLLAATHDGDFQHCVVAAGTLYIDHTIRKETTIIRRTRAFALERFASIQDMLHDDPDWLPLSMHEEF